MQSSRPGGESNPDKADRYQQLVGRVDAVVARSERLRAVAACGLLRPDADEALDGITSLARELLQVPAAFVAALDRDRDFYKSQQGFAEPLASRREVGGRTFCHYTATLGSVLAIGDTMAGAPWREVPTVESLGVRAYLGVPLRFEGEVVGSLCVIDNRSRQWSPLEVRTLEQLALSAMRELDLRRALDRARHEAAEVRRLLRDREHLLAGAVHDLRIPLQALILSMDLLARDGGSPAKTQLERMGRATSSLTRIVEQLQEAGLPPATSAGAAPSPSGAPAAGHDGEEDSTFDPAPADHAVAEACLIAAPVAEAAGVTLIHDARTRVAVQADLGMLLRALLNLIGNAVKFTPAGGQVRIRCRMLGDERPARVAFVVEDEGPGMSADELAQAFRRGWQGSAGKASGGGSGLGLAIVRSIANRFGGTVALHSVPGEGTTATLELPVAGPAEPAACPSAG